MEFNLIDEKWIPIIRRDGTSCMIAPWEITDQFKKNPVATLNAPRPDFNGALIQFLIGLVQTMLAPQSAAEWRKKLNEPPTPDELREAFTPVRHAFNFGGEGPKFMQDYEDIVAEDSCIDGLLIGAPGINTISQNTDHFIKRNTIQGLCPRCCATALFSLQTNSPSGGSGYMVSLRGGGPLTTLVLGDSSHDSLWQLVYLNVLEWNQFLNTCGNSELNEDSNIFPWLTKTREGIRKRNGVAYGEETNPQLAHPATMYWAMPRRINLNFSSLSCGVCDICGNQSNSLVNHYKEKPGGASYKGWIHPLTPYYERIEKGMISILPVHAQPSGISYRHWLGLVIQDNNEKKIPARIIHEFYNRWKSGWQFRLWAFGYDMDNMKARCWYDSTMPLICADNSIRNDFEEGVASIIKAASQIAENTRSAVKKAWFKNPGNAKGDLSFIDHAFWQGTESDFYTITNALVLALEGNNDAVNINTQWLSMLCTHSINLFDRYAFNGPLEDADPKRSVIARKELEQYNRSKKIKELLKIPIHQVNESKKKERKSK